MALKKVVRIDRYLRVSLQTVFAQLTADSRLFEAAEWSLSLQDVVRVHPNGSSSESLGEVHGFVQILGEHGGRQTVDRLIRPFQDLLHAAELEDLLDGAENLWDTNLEIIKDSQDTDSRHFKYLFLGDPHVVLYVGENGRLDEIAAVPITGAARQQLGAFLLARVNQRKDLLELILVHLGSLLHAQVERISHGPLLGALNAPSDKLVIDGVLDKDPGSSAAALALIEEESEVGRLHRMIQIAILEDNVGGFAAQLQSDSLQVGLSRGRHDQMANL